MEEIRLGTIGSGSIVRSILDNVMITPGIRLEAVYSRDLARAEALAAQYQGNRVYTDLQKMLNDPTVNFVYVASPNSLHYGHTKAALLAGKNVICEKPFTTQAAQARELVALAREKGLMLVDATPTAFLPNFAFLQQLLPKIGRVRLVMSNYSQYSSRYDQLLNHEVTNVFDPEFGGGSLMDINYYNVYLNVALFGRPLDVFYYANKWENGIDTSGSLILRYDGFISQNAGAKDCHGVNYFQIEGENGYIYIDGGSNGLSKIRLVTKDTDEVYNLQDSPDRWFYEVQHMTALLLEENRAELDLQLARMVDVMEVLEKARHHAGILFPSDTDEPAQ